MTMLIVFAVLLVYAVLTWFLAGRDPRKGDLVSRHKAPLEPNSDSRIMSAAAVDFVRNRGKLSAKGLATIFYNLSRRDLLQIERNGKKSFSISPRDNKDNAEALPQAYPEEQALYRAFVREIKKPAQLTLEDDSAAFVRKLDNTVHNSLHRQYRQLWQHNLLFVVICYILAVLALTVGLAAAQGQEGLRQSLLLAMGGLALTSVLVFGLQTLVQGHGVNRKVLGAVLFVAAAVAAFVVINSFTGKMTWPEFWAFTLILLLPPIYTLLIKAPTTQCRTILDQISGYQMFLKNKTPEDDELSAQDHVPYLLILDKDKSWLADFARQLGECMRQRKKSEPDQ